VKSFGNESFAGCGNLTTLFYMGLDAFFNVTGFNTCEALSTLCVPPDYEPISFLGCNVTNDNAVCQDFQRLFNHCYLPKLVGEMFIRNQRKNASEWQNRTYTCAKFECDNETGAFAWGTCNTTNETFLCLSDQQCIKKGAVKRDTYVVVDLEPGVDVSIMSSQNVYDNVKIMCDVSPSNDMKVAWENDEEGNVVSVIVYVDDPETARSIAAAINGMDRSALCNSGILCHARSAQVVTKELTLSGSQSIHETVSMAFLFLLVVALVEVMMLL